MVLPRAKSVPVASFHPTLRVSKTYNVLNAVRWIGEAAGVEEQVVSAPEVVRPRFVKRLVPHHRVLEVCTIPALIANDFKSTALVDVDQVIRIERYRHDRSRPVRHVGIATRTTCANGIAVDFVEQVRLVRKRVIEVLRVDCTAPVEMADERLVEWCVGTRSTCM
jgi:hypothetical protein